MLLKRSMSWDLQKSRSFKTNRKYKGLKIKTKTGGNKMNAQKFVEAKETKLQNIFANIQEAYKIPLYQRSYSWTKDQWEDLYDDIAFLEDDEIHFLGSIVVVPEHGQHRFGINHFEIVDGQQRLATVIIWLAAIRDIAKEEGNNSVFEAINKLLFVTDLSSNKLIPKLQLGRFDNEAFQAILNGSSEKFDHIIFKCYNYFRERTLRDKTQNQSLDVWKKILYNVIIVHINAFTYLNAFRLFETLNDRGLELSAADLLKNYLLMKTATNQEAFDQVVDEWMEMYDKVRKYEPVKFIRRYILSEWSGKFTEKNLYKEVTKELERREDNINILNFVKNLNFAATNYQKIFETSFDSDRINKRLYELHLIEVSPSFTLMLKVIPYWLDNKLSEDDLLEIMEMIEIFHIRWGICEQSTSKLDGIYNQICLVLKDQPVEKFKEKIKQIIFDNIKSHVDDETFRKSFSSRKFRASESRTKYVLWKLSKPTGETFFDIKNIQTEHIMPKKLSDEWIKYLTKQTGKRKDEILSLHDEYLDKIGNLTIIKGEWNVSISNRLFSEKRKEYKNSEFKITNELYDYKNWTFDEIDSRTELLAEEALKIWSWKW